MTEIPSQIEWYLARDGQQYGPLSENEMRAFVDLGHLRDTDLIWRAGFPDWRPAPDVFAIHAVRTMPAPPPAAPEPAPVAAAAVPLDPSVLQAHVTPERDALAPVEPQQPQAETVPLVSPDQLFAPGPAMAPAAAAPIAQQQSAVGAPAYAPHPQPNFDPRLAQPAARQHAAHGPRGPQVRGNAAAGRPLPEPRPTELQADLDDDFDDDVPRRRIGLGRIAAALLFAVMIGGGMAAIIKRDQLSGLLPASVMASVASIVSDRPAEPAPLIANGANAEVIDQSFQRVAVWRHIKQEYPEWYAERVQEAVKMVADRRGDSQIAKQLAEAIVALRRKHAEQALTASPERLRFVATAFLENLHVLAKQNVETCYGFISQGETYPPVLAMLLKPDGNETLQAQVIAVFDAIADGRKAPNSYLPPRKTDYDALATELNARGWSENDLRTFSDPRALGRAKPQDVCRMVQDWFAAQIAIKDGDAQLRLLVESLRPVVAG